MTQRIAIGLAAGVVTGLFLGDRAAIFALPAAVFIRLLQMAVLPFLTVSVMASIGSFSMDQLRKIGARLAVVLVVVWAVTIAFTFLLPLTFPSMQSGAFFSTTMLEQAPRLDLINLYIPSNPFSALSNNVVPAVVLFSLLVGAALIAHPRKQVLLDMLTTWSETLSIVMRRVSALTPFGVFAIVANTTGTIRIEDAARLQVYLAGYAALALLLSLWVLPGLVSILTGIPHRAIFASTRGALLTAAIAGDLFIVLPLLVDAAKELSARYGPGSDEARTLPDAIVPVAYNFPHGGKVLALSFILFAGWFSDSSLEVFDYPVLGVVGLFTFFGSVNSAIPFLLDLFRVPADTFQLYIAVGVISSRVGALVAATHTVVVALLGTFAVMGAIRLRTGAAIRYLAFTAVLALAMVGVTRFATSRLQEPPSSAAVLDTMKVERVAPEVRRTGDALDRPAGPSRLETIMSSKTLRVGYLADALPFAFVNGKDELVGLDIALMHYLAGELGAQVEFVPVARSEIEGVPGVAARLQRGDCDIIVGGLAITAGRTRLMQLSNSPLSETLAFVVRDDQRRQFESWDAIAAQPRRIAVPAVQSYLDLMRRRLPRAELVPVGTFEELFKVASTVDAVVMPAERGSAWTLRYPHLAVVVPNPGLIKVPLAYALPAGETQFATYVNTWIDLKQNDGTIQSLYDYWILGRISSAPPPRWSIIRDVLHWTQ